MAVIKKAGIVGGGVIGAGWAARLLLNGIDVAVFDLDPEVERKTLTVVANARRAYAKLLPGLLPEEGALRFAKSVEDAVADADFVQESLPEREDLKIRVLAQIDRATRPDVVIGSSTSGLLPSRLQSEMQHPGRLVVGHPFNPVYLLPLVEICGGDQTTDETKSRAAELYSAIGMHPLHVRKEIDGFIADRLLEAVWREALWLIKDGVATTTEIDDAIRYGAGLRWSFMGTFLVYRMAGGEPGMRHFLAQFGPTMDLPWTKLIGPKMTDELVETIATQSDEQAAGVSIRELETLRDDCLVSVLSALRANNYAGGAVVGEFGRRLATLVKTAAVDEGKVLTLKRSQVEADWVDYNGHMTEHRYLQVFGETTDALLGHIGVDADYLAGGRSYYTVETHIMHIAEVRGGEPLHVTTQILGADEKRLHVFHSLYRSRDETLLASAEQMLLHVNAKESRACPAEPAVLANVKRVAGAQAGLPKPASAGRHVSMPAPKG